MANYNKVLLIGNLTRDPELRYTPGGTAVADFGMAINRTWKGQDGEKREEVCFVDITAWAKQAEQIQQYCRKGRSLFVEGRLQFDQWEKDGQKRSRLRVVLENFQFLDRPGGTSGAAPNEQSRPGGAKGEAPAAETTHLEPGAPSNDDIPF